MLAVLFLAPAPNVPWTIVILVGAVVCLGFVIQEVKRRTGRSSKVGFHAFPPPLGRKALASAADFDERHVEPAIRYVRTEFLSAAENSFFRVLEMAVDARARVFAKVRIADVLDVEPGVGNSHRTVGFNKISAKHFDFILCDRNSLQVIAAVELDDRSHVSIKRQERDSLVDDACTVADLPLLRFPARHAYSIQDVASRLRPVLPEPSA